jgi:lipopolysaccharide heptosyltransferase II
MRIDPKRIQKVFVRAPNWLGDVIMATPSFARIRSAFIDAEIICGIKPGHQAILDGSRSFDGYLPMKGRKGRKAFFEDVRKLRENRFDLAILFPNSPSSALRCLLAGVPYRLGYTQGRRLLMTHGIKARIPKRRDGKRYGPRRVPVPMPHYYASLLDTQDMPRVDDHPILRVTAEEESQAEASLDQLGIRPEHSLVLLNPGAAFGSTKLWDPENWARLADSLQERLGPDTRQVVLVGPGEEDLARAITARTRAQIRAAIDPLIPLGTLKAVLRRARVMVTTDSGPRHIAVAFDVPHVVLMGPTHPDYTSANMEHGIVVRHEVDCGPCHLKTCPLDHRCMKLISPEEVLGASINLLSRREGQLPG